ncbi:hypothetical protein MWN33_05690 [Starkeya koreensis]|uniref:Phage gp6-like head-tail connector protein n=1 Tax=Ancylobacter koreensis TaxID=266121 RepID=A0ABT0DJR6_9HYPH|nr:hypothetical protein [Ancylobacter koreensis]MCK0207523.1 hypothetical protein [Ancylobacter koreensis]
MLTIITPAAKRDLTTLDAVNAELDRVTGPDDIFIGQLISQASRAVESWCGRIFAREDVRESVHLTEPAGALLLSRFPVAVINSVTTEAGSLLPALYEADSDTGMLYRLTSSGGRSIWAPGRILVDYSAGFILPDTEGRNLPADIERAAIIAVRNAYTGRGHNPALRSEEVDGVGTFSYGLPASLSTEVTDLLAPYRLPGFA